MSSKRAKRRTLQRKMCGNKQKHKTKQEAHNHVLAMYKLNKIWLRPYKCRFCKYWHIGRSDKYCKY